MSQQLISNFDSKTFLSSLTREPGIYQMYNEKGKILYVGKAKNLKNRVSSYFHHSGLAPKTKSLVSKIANIQVTVTQSEMEALILEQNLIKSQRPPYNILLRDDKSYPYIFLSDHESYSRIGLHRGSKKRKGQYFGPYPSVGAVRESLSFLQKTFRVRQCEDSIFKNRSRPCLQFQINRCKAPCVGYISEGEYAEDVRHTTMFLNGESNQLTKELAGKMEDAAESLLFEEAAQLRDQISYLRSVQSTQIAERDNGELDVIAVARQNDNICAHVLYVRQGRILGSKSYFYEEKLDQNDNEFLAAFLPQFYLGSKTREIPPFIITSHRIPDSELIQKALKQQRTKQVNIIHQVRSQRQKWLDLAQRAAQENLISHSQSQESMLRRYEALQEALEFDELPKRLECFDISHSSGELTVASCVVFDLNGAVSSDYRRFNIEGITGGDDYAAMNQAITRRYTRLQKGEGVLPDILLIDGGKGQLNKAKEVMQELGIDGVRLLGVAKGSTRKAGFETLFLDDIGNVKNIDSDSPALHLIQSIRDEAHRFAITGHKNRRDKKRRTSTLEDIPGVGAKRRRELLRHFGGLQEVKKASIEELSKVQNISKKIAEDIYSALHS
ncbi:MAG: excinuclease ABC subunit UvrC [Cellvibrionaceae bacterium]